MKIYTVFIGCHTSYYQEVSFSQVDIINVISSKIESELFLWRQVDAYIYIWNIC